MRGEVKRIQPRLRTFSTGLRRNQTDAEQKLWRQLRNRQIRGWKFRRQHSLGQYIVDFCCLEQQLIVELDGGQHLEQQHADQRRTKALELLGFRVLRFWDHEVLTQIDDVLEQIVSVVEEKNQSTLPHPLLSRERVNQITLSSVEDDSAGKHPHPTAFSLQEEDPEREREYEVTNSSLPSFPENFRMGEREKKSHVLKPPVKKKKTPGKVGYRMPAEWEPHEATWLGWPHNTTDWPGKMAIIPWVYGEIVRQLANSEMVRILVNNKAHELKARRVLERVGVDFANVEFFRIPTNRGWTRDFGPIFVQRELPNSEVAIARFQFTAWARYSDWQRDNRIPERLATKLQIPLVPVEWQERGVVLEGGSVDVNGQGTLLTTEECLLDDTVQVRNPGFTRRDYEDLFRAHLGITQVLWFGKGIAGDDTHGHVDDVCRFVDPYTVVLCQEENPSDENYRPLAENRERLEGMRCEDGRKVGVVALPMPAPLFFQGQRLPASYANFYIANSAVLMPTFNDPKDRVALGILSELFYDRPVVGIHAVDLVWGLGTLHCLTQPQPAF